MNTGRILSRLGLAVAALIVILCGAMLTAGCASGPQASTGPGSGTQDGTGSSWAAGCSITDPDASTSYFSPIYHVQLTNRAATVQDAGTLSIVFLSNGQELQSDTLDVGQEVLAGQTLSLSSAMPDSLTRPAPNERDWTLSNATNCRVIGFADGP